MSLAPGTRVGPYAVATAIGAGGMGEVYRAHDSRLNRDVALKILPHLFAGDPERRSRFEREAQILASLNHPGIAHMYGLENHASGDVLVMELVEGRTLSAILADNPHGLPVDEALAIARQLADALEAAHERGIIHRDLKPGNVMVSDEDRVKVLDFGLARSVEVADAAVLANSPTTRAPSLEGVILGTAAYMAPEQARGRAADKRADIWAFGCVLYEMLTGTRAFTGEGVTDTLAAIIHKDPDWSRLPSDVPPAVRLLLEKCLVKDRHDRLGDASAIKMLLSPAALSLGAPAAGRSASRLRSLIGWTAVTLLAIAGAVTTWMLTRTTDAGGSVRFQHFLPDGQTFGVPNAASGSLRHVAISPDGTKIVFAVKREMYLRSIDESDARLLGDFGDEIVFPTFSPDSAWIAFATRPKGTLRKVRTTGGAAQLLAELPAQAADLAWGHGSILVGMPGAAGIIAVPEDGGSYRTVVSVDPAIEGASQPAFIDSSHIIFTLRQLEVPANFGGNSLVAQSLDGGPRTVLVKGATAGRLIAPNVLAYSAGGSIRGQSFDRVKLETRGTPTVLMPSAGTFTVSTTGTLLFEPPLRPLLRQIVWVNRSGREEPLPITPGGYLDLRLSPDESKLAMAANADIWIWTFARETLTRLTLTDNAGEYNPAWMPDGKHVAFDSSDGSARKILMKMADGTGPLTVLVQPPTGYPECVSPDGRFLVYHTQSNIGIIQPLDKPGPARPLSPSKAQAFNADISRDGRWIAYQSNESGRFEIYVHPFPALDAGRSQVSPNGGSAPLWSKDGKELFFIDAAGMLVTVPVRQVNGIAFGKPTALFHASQYPVNTARDYNVSSDAKRFLFVKNVQGTPTRDSFTIVTRWVDSAAAAVAAR